MVYGDEGRGGRNLDFDGRFDGGDSIDIGTGGGVIVIENIANMGGEVCGETR
jgi:2-polyprenyl-3-methyl-5-hydroxy-6-metoxy-1,4-benzoquinol methylase